MKKNTFKILFHIRGNYTNKEWKSHIIIRIAINEEYERINSTLSIEPELWDAKAGRAIGRTAKVLELNKRLEDMRVVLKEHYYDLLNRHGYITAEMVKNLYVARHSWASAAKAKGIPLSVISEGMGHDNEATTQIYLTSLDTSVVDQANSIILDSISIS